MNDRFKFRAWDRINDKWLSSKNCIEIETGYLTDFYDVEQAFNKRYILMQCTGLKDKNGKLIYEGDIVKTFFDRDVVIGVISWYSKELRYYLNTTDYFKDKYVTDYEIYNTEDYEVIGNIYENKELLESEG